MGVVSSRNFNAVGDVAETLLEAGGVAGMDLKHPALGRLVVGMMGIFNGEL